VLAAGHHRAMAENERRGLGASARGMFGWEDRPAREPSAAEHREAVRVMSAFAAAFVCLVAGGSAITWALSHSLPATIGAGIGGFVVFVVGSFSVATVVDSRRNQRPTRP
jgi:hypothetical protein